MSWYFLQVCCSCLCRLSWLVAREPAVAKQATSAVAGPVWMVGTLFLQAPVLLRLAFHDAGTFDVSGRDGGANGSVAFELDRPENKVLKEVPHTGAAAASQICSKPDLVIVLLG